MERENLINSRKPTASQLGDSDDFVLPVAPPAVPVEHKPLNSRPVTQPPVVLSSHIAAGQGSAFSSHQPSAEHHQTSAAPRQPRPSSPPSSILSPPPLIQTIPNKESRDSSPSTSVPVIAETSGKSASWSLVGILGFIVIILFTLLVNKDDKALPITTSTTLAFEDHARALAAAQSKIEAARSKNAKIELGMRELEDQLAVEKRNSEEKIANLIRQQRALESNRVELMVEVDRLKRQILASTAKVQFPAPAPQPEPVAQNTATTHKISGLVYGDYLNIRSGPGANFSVVRKLQNGDLVSVVGSSVTNESELWAPCLIEVTSIDPATGVAQSLKKKGWVNAHFLD